MELHSYAKRRTSKKWTIEQKRKLVEARIAHDAWFTNKPSSVVPWKNILVVANLDDFNVFFVRKQWSNMLARYKQYKQTRLGNIASKTIDAELIKRINQEWEFFEPIHTFMTRKTTNLHSYALTHQPDNKYVQQEIEEELVQNSIEEQYQAKSPFKLFNEAITKHLQKDCAKENIPNNTTIVLHSNNVSIDDGIHLFSSDTNEEFQVISGDKTRTLNGSREEDMEELEYNENITCTRNTDHDFYSKRITLGDIKSDVKRNEEELQEQQSNYFADASEESQSSMNMVIDLIQSNVHPNRITPLNVVTVRNVHSQTFEVKSENITQNEIVGLKEEVQDPEFLNDMPSTSTRSNLTQNLENMPTYSSSSHLNEREKYYRHKRRFNRRLEKRFDAILQVMSQIIKTEYPSVDVTPLVGTVTSLASNVGKMFSSDSENDNESEKSDNFPATSYEKHNFEKGSENPSFTHSN